MKRFTLQLLTGFLLCCGAIAVAGSPGPRPVYPIAAQSDDFKNPDLIGRYVLDKRYDYMVISEEGGKLFAQPAGQSKKPLYHNKGLEFFLPGKEATITFTKNKKGLIAGLVVRYKNTKLTGEKVD